MNIFFVYANKLVTPRLTDSILPGITRDSVLALAPQLGYEVEEKDISIDEVLSDIKSGTLTESCGTGTAAVLAPVGELFYKGEKNIINDNKVGKVTRDLYKRLVGIQYGIEKDVFGWFDVAGKI